MLCGIMGYLLSECALLEREGGYTLEKAFSYVKPNTAKKAARFVVKLGRLFYHRILGFLWIFQTMHMGRCCLATIGL